MLEVSSFHQGIAHRRDTVIMEPKEHVEARMEAWQSKREDSSDVWLTVFTVYAGFDGHLKAQVVV